MKNPIQKWNREVFGHIHRRINCFQEEIIKLENTAQDKELLEQEWLRKEALHSQLWLWMTRKERYWKQLSQCKWIREGDRNSKYFHLTASMRRQWKAIDMLMIDEEEVCDRDQIKRALSKHLKLQYRKPVETSFDMLAIGLQKLKQEDFIGLEEPITTQEITEALWSCDPSKAPRYDGFN